MFWMMIEQWIVAGFVSMMLASSKSNETTIGLVFAIPEVSGDVLERWWHS